jgi:hypothetical protein
MDGPPPELRLIGPAANNPRYEKVSEIRRRLGEAYMRKSTTAEQKEKILFAEADLGYASDDARLSIPIILLEVEAMPRPANGGARKRSYKKRTLRKLRMRKRTHRKKTQRNRRTHRK